MQLFLANASPEVALNAKAAIIEAIRSLAAMPGRYPFFTAEHIPQNKYHRMYVRK